jgi:hypothetical protein
LTSTTGRVGASLAGLAGLALRLGYGGEASGHPASAFRLFPDPPPLALAYPLETTSPLFARILGFLGPTAPLVLPLLATFCGAIATVLIFRVLREISGPPAAWLGAGLWWLSPWAVAEDAAGTLLSLHCCVVLLFAGSVVRTSLPLLCTAATAAGALDLLLAVVVLPALALTGLRVRARGGSLRGTVAAAALVVGSAALAWLPWGTRPAREQLLAWVTAGVLKGSFASSGILALLASSSRLAEFLFLSLAGPGLFLAGGLALSVVEGLRAKRWLEWPWGGWWPAVPVVLLLVLSEGADATPLLGTLFPMLVLAAAQTLARLDQVIPAGRAPWVRTLLGLSLLIPLLAPFSTVSLAARSARREAAGTLSARLASLALPDDLPVLARALPFWPAALALPERTVFRWEPVRPTPDWNHALSQGHRIGVSGAVVVPAERREVLLLASSSDPEVLPPAWRERALVLAAGSWRVHRVPIRALDECSHPPALAIMDSPAPGK